MSSTAENTAGVDIFAGQDFRVERKTQSIDLMIINGFSATKIETRRELPHGQVEIQLENAFPDRKLHTADMGLVRTAQLSDGTVTVLGLAVDGISPVKGTWPSYVEEHPDIASVLPSGATASNFQPDSMLSLGLRDASTDWATKLNDGAIIEQLRGVVNDTGFFSTADLDFPEKHEVLVRFRNTLLGSFEDRIVQQMQKIDHGKWRSEWGQGVYGMVYAVSMPDGSSILFALGSSADTDTFIKNSVNPRMWHKVNVDQNGPADTMRDEGKVERKGAADIKIQQCLYDRIGRNYKGYTPAPGSLNGVLMPYINDVKIVTDGRLRRGPAGEIADDETSISLQFSNR